MKIEKEEIVFANIERNPLVLVISLLISAGFIYLTYISIFNKEAFEVKPMGFFLFVPTLFACFQTLWFIVNPFGIVYEDRFEIKKSFFNLKQWYFIDIKKIGSIKNTGFSITYNDNEVERLNLVGIKPAHKIIMQQWFAKQVDLSLQKRLANS